MFSIQTLKTTTPAAVKQWATNVRAAGGGFEANSMSIANNFVRTLQSKSYYAKIVYLLPMLGVGVGAARSPLIDRLGVGSATNTSFVDADFSQSTGLQGNGSTKYLTVSIKPSQLGSSNSGGLGWWENNIAFAANVEPIGCYNNSSNNRYVLDLRNSLQSFRWGDPSNGATLGTTAANAHYYGQRSGATSRTLYRDASQIASNTTSDSTSGAGDTNIAVVGALEPGAAPWPGRGALAYFTDGTLSDDEIADFHTLLVNFLMVPTGKPQS